MSSFPESTATPVKVYALSTTVLHHPDRWLFEDGDPDLVRVRHAYPDFNFLIHHPSGQYVLFDLALRKDLENCPEPIKKAFDMVQPSVSKDVREALEEGPVSPSSITSIVLSHLHFDHIGDPSKFPDTTIIAGPGSSAANGPGSQTVTTHRHYHELSFETDPWRPLGPFDRAHDFFGDGTFFLLDTPGHSPGHLGGLALTGHNEWVLMGGDCCHHRSLLVGSRPMSVTMGPAGMSGFHADPDQAKRTIATIRSLANKNKNVLVALAHDHYLENKMPLYPEPLNGWHGSEWKKELDRVLEKDYGGSV